MEQSKSPKSIAYSRLGKPHSGKHSVPQQSLTRKSTGNIYEELIGEFDPKQEKYIRDLVNKNSKGDTETASTSVFHNRRKSYADLEVDTASKERPKDEKPREERETLCKPKLTKDGGAPQLATPKNNNNSSMTRSDFINRGSCGGNFINPVNKINCLIKREYSKKEQKSFLDNLSNYLQQLNENGEHVLKASIGGEKLSETLKISSGKESHTLASKLQQSLIKIKELKLKNHCIEKQLAKRTKRQKKMKECLYQMLEEIKQVNKELSRQKKQRKRLQKIIQNFELRSQQFQRKTIGKHYNLSKIQQFQNKINEFSQNEYDRNDMDSSFRDIWKHATTNHSKNRNPIYIAHDYDYEHPRRGQLDSNKIEQLFKSKYHSQDEDSC